MAYFAPIILLAGTTCQSYIIINILGYVLGDIVVLVVFVCVCVFKCIGPRFSEFVI